MVYKIFWRGWFWLSQFSDEHTPIQFFKDWPCQCGTCMSYAGEERDA